jgi:hypothetical protein
LTLNRPVGGMSSSAPPMSPRMGLQWHHYRRGAALLLM